MLRGKGFHGLEDPQVLISSACSKTTLVTFSEYNRLLLIRYLYGYNETIEAGLEDKIDSIYFTLKLQDRSPRSPNHTFQDIYRPKHDPMRGKLPLEPNLRFILVMIFCMYPHHFVRLLQSVR